MVVCKCRKATKLYCFVHKVPVCGECICFSEHQICVVRTYSEWVIDGEYDWPPSCCMCHAVLEESTDSQTTRLGCLHVIHTHCLASLIKSFPPHTAPAGYVCPGCSTPIWPPKSIKDSGSQLHTKLKEVIMQTGVEKSVFGNHPVSMPVTGSRGPPPAFASDPLVHMSGASGEGKDGSKISEIQPVGNMESASRIPVPNTLEIDGSSSAGNYVSNSSPPGATTRKGGFLSDRQSSEVPYYADDEDGNLKKYSRRGSFRHKFLRALLPFWSSSLPTLPVTAPSKKDIHADEAPEVRPRHHRPSRMDPRKILLVIAIMACMATMGILYYRLAQHGFGEEIAEDEQ
uniref:RING-type domain-containing protein n=1 Tax=Kalanchoe fedtschenkoi TaxID=63787 RepID=A0A7N0TNT9_KALFE